MTDCFLTILDMSLSASWLVLAIIAARFLLKKAPRWLTCSLWALVALRLICPFSFESAVSLIPEFSIPPTTVEETLPERVQDLIWDTSSSPGDKMSVAIPDNEGIPVVYEVYLSEDGTTKPVAPRQVPLAWPRIAASLWLAGITALLLYAAVSYLRIRKKVQASIDLGHQVFLCDYIQTPFILGILRPKIYLPSEMDPRDAAHVLAHERAHLKRRDHWWKPLGFVLLCLHWFNPLLWIAYILLCRDIELACDERVIKTMGKPEKKAYSEALLKCSIPRHMILACPLAFGEVGVKQRIRSVLRYKKPSFWIILVSIPVILTIAVCFLTEPQRHTVANILELHPQEISKILLWSRTSRADFEEKEKVEEFWDFLNTLEFDPVPVSGKPIEEDLDDNNWNYQTIDIYCKDRVEHILFNYDYSLVWTRDSDGNNSLPYRMQDPSLLRDYMNDHVTPVNNRETSAAPFAKQDQPAQWLQGVCMDALRSVCFCNDYTNYLSAAQARELIDILNSIPESAIGDPCYDEDFTFDHRTQSIPLFLLRDDANDLTGILTYYNDSIELSLVDSSNFGMRLWENAKCTAYICTVSSKDLASFFGKLAADPPNLLATSASGYLFNEKLEVISDGEFTMSFHTLENWDYEIIHPEAGEDFFGFRCRPKKEEKGWITFGWWGDRFQPGNKEAQGYSTAYGYHYTYIRGSLDPSVDSESRYDRAHCDHGDFVTIYENTDSWNPWYQDVATWLYAFMNIKCETNHSLTTIPDTVASDLVNAAYYDWDSIAREIGAEHMTLFSPQYYEDYLFVGCQFEGGYRIACFRKVEAYDYEFADLITPDSKSLPSNTTQALPTAELDAEDTTLSVYILDDDTVTGVKCKAGHWAYLPVSSCPALIVLDKTLWNAEVQFDLCRNDLPMLYFHTQTNGSIAKFRESPQHYLYNCIANYNDGSNNLSAFSLEPQELHELSDLLLSLPDLTENVFPESYEAPFDLAAAASGTPVIHMQLYLDEAYSYLWSQDGIVMEEPGGFRLMLYYYDGNLTLGVNMTDLGQDQNRDFYYYKIESPELEDFLLSKCDEAHNRIFPSDK